MFSTAWNFGVFYFLLRVTCILTTSFANEEVMDSQRLNQMFSGYDRNVRPNFTHGPVDVVADLYIESFGNIQEANMEYTVYGYFRQHWVDKCLAGKFNHTVVLQSTATEHAWMPDTFCSNARQSDMQVKGSNANSAMAVLTNGSIFFSRGVRLVASCDMSLHDFPVDQQQCFLTFLSYGYDTKDIVYRWAKDSITVERKNIAQFQLEKVQLVKQLAAYTLGNHSQLTIRFDFRRRVGYYVMQVYAPDVLVVAISWTLFWMDKNDMNTRMAVGITTILTIVFLLGSANVSLPRVSYAKAIDWYLMVSFTFIFAALLECMLVFHFRSDGKENRKKNKSAGKKARCVSEKVVAMIKHRLRRGSFRIDDVEVEAGPPVDHKSATLECLEEGRGKLSNNSLSRDVSDKIDLASRWLFPLSFFLFNVVYWFTYINDVEVLSVSSRDA